MQEIQHIQIITAYGLIVLAGYIKRYKKLIYTFLAVFLFLNVFYFLHGLFVHYTREYSSEWQYTYKEVVLYLEKEKANYDHVYFTDKLGRPYVFFLTYGKIFPKECRYSAKCAGWSEYYKNFLSFRHYSFTCCL